MKSFVKLRFLELKTLYELRKTLPINARRGIGRVFMAEGKFGLTDVSGTLWPIYFDSEISLPSAGDIIHFECDSFRQDSAPPSKYEDGGYSLKVAKVLEKIESNGQWYSRFMDSPLPPSSDFSVALKQNQTYFFKSPLVQRSLNLAAFHRSLTRVREFFKNRGFLEIESPTLVPSGGIENYLNLFETNYKDFRGNLWPLNLPTSPEFSLKKILTEGHSKIFQIARAYRNHGEMSAWHEPEFHMLEWYRKGQKISGIMSDTQTLVKVLADTLGSSDEIPADWEVYTVNELFKHCYSIDLTLLQDADTFRKVAEPICFSITPTDDWDTIFHKLFMEKIENYLKEKRFCFVTDFPVQMSALARKSTKNPLFVERFEGYIHGIEICNGYHELSDSRELAARFSEILTRRESEVSRDEMFEDAMHFGLPPCAGNALGLGRVVALLLGEKSLSSLHAIPFAEHVNVAE